HDICRRRRDGRRSVRRARRPEPETDHRVSPALADDRPAPRRRAGQDRRLARIYRPRPDRWVQRPWAPNIVAICIIIVSVIGSAWLWWVTRGGELRWPHSSDGAQTVQNWLIVLVLLLSVAVVIVAILLFKTLSDPTVRPHARPASVLWCFA